MRSLARFKYIQRFVVTPCRMIRSHGLLFPLCFGLRLVRHKWLTCRVRTIYFRSQHKYETKRPTDGESYLVEEIVSIGVTIASRVKKEYDDRYSERTDLRFLFNVPPKGAAYYYFLDLAQCLRHTGVKVHLFASSGQAIDKALSDFQPSVFLTCDSPWGAGVSPTEAAALLRYKERYRLARLYLPHYSSPLRVTRPTRAILDRIGLHRNGQLADAFFGYFEEVFWEVFCDAWRGSGCCYYSIPFAANPFRHHPLSGARSFDWAIATVNGDLGARAKLTLKYMSRIMREYSGAIAGDNWGKGIVPVPPDQISHFLSAARISPNIAAEENVRYPLDCGAKVHELSAMGVFQLTSETEALRKYYPHTEIVGCTTAAEFNALFDYFVHKPDLRQMFITKSMARTFAENTYFHRIDRLVDILDTHREWF